MDINLTLIDIKRLFLIKMNVENLSGRFLTLRNDPLSYFKGIKVLRYTGIIMSVHSLKFYDMFPTASAFNST